MVRDSGAMGPLRTIGVEPIWGQGDSLMGGPGGRAGLSRNWKGMGPAGPWLWPKSFSHIQDTHCDLVTHVAAKNKGGDPPVTVGGSGTSGLFSSSDCAMN